MGAVWIKIVYVWEFVFNLVRPPIFSQKVRYLVNILIPIIRPYYRALVRSALSGTVKSIRQPPAVAATQAALRDDTIHSSCRSCSVMVR